MPEANVLLFRAGNMLRRFHNNHTVRKTEVGALLKDIEAFIRDSAASPGPPVEAGPERTPTAPDAAGRERTPQGAVEAVRAGAATLMSDKEPFIICPHCGGHPARFKPGSPTADDPDLRKITLDCCGGAVEITFGVEGVKVIPVAS